VKNKVDSLKGYDSVEASDDVIKLLNDLKKLTFKTHKVRYGYRTISYWICPSFQHLSANEVRSLEI
jgi:hypothetical protein